MTSKGLPLRNWDDVLPSSVISLSRANHGGLGGCNQPASAYCRPRLGFWWPPHRFCNCRATFFIFRVLLMVEPRGLEPLTFSLQGNCAPNCATAPNQTTVIIEVSVSDLFVQHNSVLGRRPESCSTELSTLYSTAGCDFFLNPIPSRGFPSLL